jgi:hypothetical protein
MVSVVSPTVEIAIIANQDLCILYPFHSPLLQVHFGKEFQLLLVTVLATRHIVS